jgi:hypothetical protein
MNITIEWKCTTYNEKYSSMGFALSFPREYAKVSFENVYCFPIQDS